MTQIKQLTARVNEISIMREQIAKAINAFETYSYQYNIKNVGMPTVVERETTEQTAELCLKLFSALGVQNVPSLTSILLAGCLLARLLTGQTLLCANLYGESQKRKS